MVIYPLGLFLVPRCPWTRDVFPPSPSQMLWEAWDSDLGWADPTTPSASAHGDTASFVPLFGWVFFFLIFGWVCLFFTFPSPPFQTKSLRASAEASPPKRIPATELVIIP